MLPFLLAALVITHLTFIHVSGSEGEVDADDIDFYPYFYLKDVFILLIMLASFIIIICFIPNMMGHPDNYIVANNLITPVHLVPEWYFLPFYAILRSTPDKFGGLLMMGLGLFMMFDNITNDDENSLILLIMLG